MKTFFDPVCGMTVDESALRLEGYENVAFCAPGCRTAFLADPERYTSAQGGLSPLTAEEGAGHSHGCGHQSDLPDNDTGCCGGNGHRADHVGDQHHHSANSAGHETDTGKR